MTESTTQNQEPKVMNFEVGQKYTTSEGNEYVVDFISRESGNIDDLFIVYKKVSGGDGGEVERYYLKKTTDFKSVDDFDEEIPSLPDNEPESPKEETEDVSIGQKYKHFKSGDSYVIKAIAHNPKNPKNKFVIYEGQYDSEEFGHNPIWVREYEEFTSMKVFGENELDGSGRPKASVKRFELITK